MVPLVHFCFCCLCLGVKSKKIIAETNVKELFPIFFLGTLWLLVLCLSFKLFWIDFTVWFKMRIQFHFFACGFLVFPAPFIEDTILSPCVSLVPLSKISWPYICGFISGLPILFHSPMFLFLGQYHTVLITTALQYTLKSRSVLPPSLFFFLKIT